MGGLFLSSNRKDSDGQGGDGVGVERSGVEWLVGFNESGCGGRSGEGSVGRFGLVPQHVIESTAVLCVLVTFRLTAMGMASIYSVLASRLA